MSWGALTESHCKVCHQQFTSDQVADKHEPYCSSDPAATAESLTFARSKAGNPLFDLRERKGRKVWVGWRSEPHYRSVS
jgi:hypothetical protein